MRLKGNSLKWLRTFHIISASIWFGATVCIGVLAVMIFFGLSESIFLATAPLIPKLYRILIFPIAVFTIMQGLVYGFFSNWGFIKYGWVLLKWTFTLLLIPCIGIGTIGQIFSVIDKVKISGFHGGLFDGGLVILFIFLQILIMLIMISISVFKPKKKIIPSVQN